MQQLSRLWMVLALAGVCFAQLEPRERPMPPTATAPAHPAGKAAVPAAQKPPTTAARKTTTAANKAAPKTKGKQARKQAAPEAALPPPPPTPEHLPATRPTVTYRNGQLAIVANNSTMSDVLNQVRQQTGAQFDMTGVAPSDRVYAKLGPGAPKDVLAALLGGTRFNFAILGGATDPNTIARVVLMPKTASAPDGTTMAAQPQVFRQPQPQPQAQEPDEEEMPVVEEEPPPPSEEQPEQQNQPGAIQQGQPGQVKTPEQLLQELQQMQQQQQQQQQQQNPPQQQIPDHEIPD